MLKNKKYPVIVIIGMIFVTIGLIWYFSQQKINYVQYSGGEIYKNYYCFSNYDRLLEEWGKPQNEYASTYNNIECWVVCYDGVTAVFAYDSEEQKKYYLINAVVSSDDFWKGNSFIGWKKSKIEKKFKYSVQAYIPRSIIYTYLEDGSKMDYEIEPYYDEEGIYGIGFIYDNDNIVEKVVFTCGII